MKNELEIYNKDKQSAKKHFETIVNEIPLLDMQTGMPLPVWENTSELEERMQELKVPGISISVINNFEIEWSACYGIKDVRTNEKVTLDTLFEGCSTSKTFTSVAILNLIDRELISLDSDVNQYLKTWKIPTNDFTQKNRITLRHLLTHTSGINRPDSMFGVEDSKIPTIEQVLNGVSPAINDAVEVNSLPGKEHNYSNFGYIIIQKLLEDLEDSSFPKIIKDVIFNPLNMINSTFEFPSGELKSKSIVPHDDQGIARESGLHPTALGQGGILTTPTELCLFLVELMNSFHGRSNKLLSHGMTKEMLSSQLKLDPAKYFGFTSQGLGIFLIEEEDKLLITHPGTNLPGATCLMIANPVTGQGAVIMANGINGELLNLQILYSIIKEYKWTKMWLFR